MTTPDFGPCDHDPDVSLLSADVNDDIAILDSVMDADPAANNKNIRLVEAMAFKHADNIDVLWRCVRCYYMVGEEFPPGSKEGKGWYDFALTWAERAHAIDLKAHPRKNSEVEGEDDEGASVEKSKKKEETSGPGKKSELPDGEPTHAKVLLWYGIAIGGTVKSLSAKEQIAQSHKIKNAFKKAVEIAPEDAYANHCLGALCFELSQMGWLARSAATLLFGAPPCGTLEEAAESLEKGRQLFAKQNVPEAGRLWNYGYLGLTMSKMKTLEREGEAVDTNEEAKKYLGIATSLPDHDSRSRKEMLKRCGDRLGKLK